MNMVRHRYQGTLPDISEDGAVSQKSDNKNLSILNEPKGDPSIESTNTGGSTVESPKTTTSLEDRFKLQEKLIMVTVRKSMMKQVSALKEGLQMLSFMITDCEDSFKEKRKYEMRRRQRLHLYKTIISIIFMILLFGFFYLIII